MFVVNKLPNESCNSKPDLNSCSAKYTSLQSNRRKHRHTNTLTHTHTSLGLNNDKRRPVAKVINYPCHQMGRWAKKKSLIFLSFFPQMISECGFDRKNDNHMLMDDHRLVLIKNTDRGEATRTDECICEQAIQWEPAGCLYTKSK